ncbi:MAG: signal peptidase I [Bacteriovoracaceae bacterium]
MSEQSGPVEETKSTDTASSSQVPVLDQNGKPILSKKEKFKKEFKSISLIILGVLAFRSTFFEPFKIPSGSMIPTLMIGDFILVNKFAYGFKIPFSDWFSDPIYVNGPAEPIRGDVIVFKYPKDPSINYIKRVIGIPGDTLEIKNKIVFINGIPQEGKEFDGKEIMEDMDENFKKYNFKFYKMKTGTHDHTIQINEDNAINDNYYPITIPKGQFFVMGDNRDFSADSRYWKFVPMEYIKGRAVAVWFSLTIPWPGTEDTFKMRPWRIGHVID